MFPLSHFFINKQLATVTPLLTLGGMWPDISAGCCMERGISHNMGRDFLYFCRKNQPHALDLAWGILYHGATPEGADYYADEFWPGGEKGWCFQKGRKYIPDIAKATKLPDDFLWWKSHNFVEMALELITFERNPKINTQILSLAADTSAQAIAVKALKAYYPISEQKTVEIFANIANIFVLKEINIHVYAENQAKALKRRFGICDFDISAMEKIIWQIKSEIAPEYDQMMTSVINEIKRNNAK